MLLDEVDTDQSLEVLDLGSPNQAVVDMFFGMRVRLHMGDLLRGLGWSLTPEFIQKPVTAQSLSNCLSHVDGQRFDAILAWDLLNYFPPDELQNVLTHLQSLSHTGTLLHCFVFVCEQRPAIPSRLTPTRRRRLRYEPQTDELVTVDTTLASTLKESLPRFALVDDARFGDLFTEQIRKCKQTGAQVA